MTGQSDPEPILTENKGVRARKKLNGQKVDLQKTLPYRICEDKMFSQITGTKMNRNTISSGMKSDFKELRNKLRLELNETNYIALTTDIWSASNKINRPYCTYSAHFMDKGELTYAVLDFKILRHPHNATVLRTVFYKEASVIYWISMT